MAALPSLDVETQVAATIRQLRTTRGWSVRQAAERADVGRSTISRWERGEAQPSGPELARYYAAFGMPLPSPEEIRPATEEGRPVSISRADLLRALRGRQGLSLEAAAESLGVSKPVLSRYESGARTPSPEVAEGFARGLRGSEAEIRAAREGVVRLATPLRSLDDVAAQVARLTDAAETGVRDLDLSFLALDGWLRKREHDAAAQEVRLTLAGTYVRWLGWWYRDREADRWARRDLDLMTRHPHLPVWGRLWRARAVYVSEIDRQPRTTADMLGNALRLARGYGGEGRLARELAGILTTMGDYAEAMRTLGQARNAGPGDETAEMHAFCCDAVEAGLWAAQGQYERALAIAYDRLPPAGFLRFALAGSRADVLVRVGEAKTAVRELDSLARYAHAAGLPHFAFGLERRSNRIARANV